MIVSEVAALTEVQIQIVDLSLEDIAQCTTCAQLLWFVHGLNRSKLATPLSLQMPQSFEH